MSEDGFYLGGIIDAAGERTGETVRYEAHHLTTHGVIVGMTGSGKTGLGVVLLEEALLSGIPALVIDPKGDMGNLCLSFPDFRPADFRPWVDAAEARRKGQSTDELASGAAALWKKGLAGWAIEAERLRRLQASADVTIYTPGSSAGVALNVIGALEAPRLDWDVHGESLTDEIESYVASLLTMAGIKSDPIASPEHILLANLIEASWRAGRDLDLATLIGQVVKPPIRKLGVFDLDTFFPPGDRMKLAMRLNGLVASPSFSAWLGGEAMDVASMLYTPDGKPRAAVVYLSHLSDAERQMVVTMLLSRVVTWMRRQKGTSDLRAILYMDEVFGFAPPTAQPPSKKPILTILKQARAFGVGMVLSTQNPVDLDYKAMSNAGTWMVGRLQTERDKLRILEGLQSASGDIDMKALDALVGGLGKRQFVLHTARSSQPKLFTTRWAQSYLCGPLSREQVSALMRERSALQAPEPARELPVRPVPPRAAPTQAEPGPGGETEIDSDETPISPTIAAGVAVRFLDPAATWADEVDARHGSKRLEAALVARVHMVFDDRAASLDHSEEWECVLFPLSARLDPEDARTVDYDRRDFDGGAPEGARYVAFEAPLAEKTAFTAFERDLKAYLLRNRALTVFRNARLKLWSRVGESEERFGRRCEAVADDRADAETAKLKDKLGKRIDRVLDQVRSAEHRVRELDSRAEALKSEEMMSGAGSLLNMFLKGKVRTRSLSAAAKRRSRTAQARDRARAAQEKVTDKQMELAELEDDFQREVADIAARWDDVAADIEAVEVGLERSDIEVQEVAVVWVPV